MVSDYLLKIHEEYIESKLVIDKEIASLEIKLRENIEFIKLLESTENTGYELFSPRNVNSKHREQIKELKEKQKDIIEKIDQLKSDQEQIASKIDEIAIMIKETKSMEKKCRIQDMDTESESEDDDTENNEFDKDEFEEKINHEINRLKILEIQEDERQRISRELHDSTVQNLTGIVHKAELCSKLIDIDSVRCKLELSMMSKTLREIINDMRQMIYNLRPMSFDDIGLDITIERAIDKIKNDNQCNIGFTVEGTSYQIHPVVGITLLRIIQEACNNAIKYAESTTILVKMIYQENSVIVMIEDDGKGFDIENLDVAARNDNSGFGLSMMKERVYLLTGEINIISKEDNGTKIIVEVPIYKKEGK